MRKLFTLLVAMLLTASVFAQAPEKMSYQAVIRNTSGTLVTSTQIGMEINIRQGSETGTVVYTETQTPTTNANGLVSIEIGGGVGFSTINWGADNYYIETKTAVVAPLTTYTITGVSKLLSVPYALNAKTAESITGTITETDPIYTGSQAANITPADITKLSNLSGTNTGDQDLSGLATTTSVSTSLDGKVDKVTGKGLSTEDYTTAEKTKLTAITGTNTGDQDLSTLATKTALGDSTALIRSELPDVSGFATTISVTTGLDGKIDKVIGKGLSTEDYTTAEKTKLAGIAAGAQVNVQADWNQTTNTADDYIKNKPTIPTAADGSETKINAGTNVTVTGSGTSASPYVVNAVVSLTQVQRDALTPVEGLIVYNNTSHKPNYYNGTEWMNYDGTSAKTLAIGVSHQGGIIFYIFQPGDLDYIEGQTHGLISATSDQGTDVSWHESYTTVGAWATEIGTGSDNTTLIISTLGNTGTYAAKICRDYTGGGYNDWYLPSKYELFTLYQNKWAVGNLANENYWSSSEGGQYLGCAQYFGSDVKQILDKYQLHNVRAIRTF